MCGHLREIGRLIYRLHALRLDSREIEQRVDELEQAQTIAVDQVHLIVVLRRDSRVGGLPLHLLERTQHQGQRRAKFVADVGEEPRLAAIDLGERLGPPALGFQISLIPLGSDPFGDIHSGRNNDDHFSERIPDWHAGEVNDVLRTISPEIQRLAAEWFAGDGSFDCVADPRLHLRRTIPPAAFPEGLVEYVGTIEATDFDGGPIDVEDRTVEAETRGEQALVVNRLELLCDLPQLPVGFLHFLCPQHHLELLRLAIVRGCLPCVGDFGYVFDAVQDM